LQPPRVAWPPQALLDRGERGGLDIEWPAVSLSPPAPQPTMTSKPDPAKRPEPDAGPESMLPGERTGEGAKDLFKHIERDQRRKAGLPSRRKPEDKSP